jgi:GNAT superfamily N-acetyltransferase
MEVRSAEDREVGVLAKLWYDGWQDAHASILPPELARFRTLESFRERMRAGLKDTRVVGPLGEPIGLCMLKGDELYQLYVSAAARGMGVAAALIADAEMRLAAAGFTTGWLACAIGNLRAARFYEKSGWVRVGTVTSRLATPEGIFPLNVWRYEKQL